MASTIEDLLRANAAYAETFAHGDVDAPPRRKLAVLTCMDARIDPAAVLGLTPGDAHVVRNGGGLATDDAIRSLVASQHALGTEEIVVMHHTECGQRALDDAALRAQLEQETGVKPPWAVEPMGEEDAAVARAVQRIRTSPFLLHRDRVRGFVYDVRSGRVREVDVS